MVRKASWDRVWVKTVFPREFMYDLGLGPVQPSGLLWHKKKLIYQRNRTLLCPTGNIRDPWSGLG